MPTIEFKFPPKQRVRTVLGDEGVIDSCAFTGKMIPSYYVLVKGGNGSWFDEDQLEAVEG